MDLILYKLQTIIRAINQIPLSRELVHYIKTRVTNVREQLSVNSIQVKETIPKTLCDEILKTMTEIESLLFLPAVNHLLSFSSEKARESSNSRIVQRNFEAKVKLDDQKNLCQLQCTGTKEQLQETRARISPFSENDSVFDDGFWKMRKKRIHEILGDSSLRFDKSLERNGKPQPAVDSAVEISNKKGRNLAKDQTRRISFRLPDRRCLGRYDQKCVDKFWGISDDFSEDGDKVRKFGDTICVLNCRSELKKLTDFLKTEGLRSFYIKRKPNGLAGNKGTWLTPPYVPPLVVKYGWPE